MPRIKTVGRVRKHHFPKPIPPPHRPSFREVLASLPTEEDILRQAIHTLATLSSLVFDD